MPETPITIADPITATAIAALNLASVLAQIYLLELQSMTPEQRAAKIQDRIDRIEALSQFWAPVLGLFKSKP
jgi:hypothetical protein